MSPIVKCLTVIILLGVSIPGFSTRSHTAVVSGQALPRVTSATHRVYVLRGSGMFSRGLATASVTRLSSTQFSLSLQAEHLPAPGLLLTKFPRRAYVAWLVDGALMRGPMQMRAVGLVFNRRTGTYQGQGLASIGAVNSVIVTAEPSARAYMPILPLLIVLSPVRQNQT